MEPTMVTQENSEENLVTKPSRTKTFSLTTQENSEENLATKPSKTKTISMTSGTSETVYNNLKALGFPVCGKCKGKLRSGLDRKPYCPVNDSHCPRLSKSEF